MNGLETETDGRESVDRSDCAAIAVRKYYRERILREIGLRRDQIVVLHPCVEELILLPPGRAKKFVVTSFSGFQAAVPLVAFVGRQNVEKGLDLLHLPVLLGEMVSDELRFAIF